MNCRGVYLSVRWKRFYCEKPSNRFCFRFTAPQPGTLTQAIEDITALVDKDQDGAVQGLWLMAE